MDRACSSNGDGCVHMCLRVLVCAQCTCMYTRMCAVWKASYDGLLSLAWHSILLFSGLSLESYFCFLFSIDPWEKRRWGRFVFVFLFFFTSCNQNKQSVTRFSCVTASRFWVPFSRFVCTCGSVCVCECACACEHACIYIHTCVPYILAYKTNF